MRPGNYVIIAVVAVWFLAAVRSMVRRKGGCSCGGCSTCSRACKNCNSCHDRTDDKK